MSQDSKMFSRAGSFRVAPGLTHAALRIETSWCPELMMRIERWGFFSEQPVILRLIIGVTIVGEFLTQGLAMRSTEPIPLDVRADYRFWFDVDNTHDEEIEIWYQFQGHFTIDPSFRNDSYARERLRYQSSPEISTTSPEEVAERRRREEESRQRRIEAEQHAWSELTEELGSDVAERLKQANGYYVFTGSNNMVYALDGRGELYNLTREKKYCVVLRGTTPYLPTPDVILTKMHWCQKDAEEVEKVKNEIGDLPEVLRREVQMAQRMENQDG